MDAFAPSVLVYYIAVIVVFCGYGLHRYWMLWLFYRSGGFRDRDRPAPTACFLDLPVVTVQIPMFNERHVARRIIEAACALDYPRDRLQIQVLDDSDDGSADTVRRCCERMTALGYDVDHHHRDQRTGFKAGALADGLRSARGAFICVFDADFVPPPDLLRRTIHHFTDESIGMVQTRWTHLNPDESLLTRIQALCLDGHFVIEQTARARTGRWFNFNGTAGLWRRRCIEDAGGWQHDTLTEDTDLSYRAQLAGWRFRYLPHVTCPAELPPTVSSMMGQQHRWNKGLIQTAIKLLPAIARSRASWKSKVEAWFHLTSPLPYAAMFLLTLLILPALWIGPPELGVRAGLALVLGLLCLTLGTCAAGAFYVAAQAAQRRPIGPTVLRLPALMALGVGLSLVNSLAIVEALLGHHSPFVRTPKYAGANTSDEDPVIRHARTPIPRGSLELVLGLVMVVCLVLAAVRPHTLVGIPFIALFAAGYLMVGLPRLRSALRPTRVASGAGRLA